MLYSKIDTKQEYDEVMKMIETILLDATSLGGFQYLPSTQKSELARLSRLAEAFEDSIPLMPLKRPKTLSEMLQFKMFERGWKQKQLAQFLGISESTISGLLSGQRKLNMALAKKLHAELKIDASFLLMSA